MQKTIKHNKNIKKTNFTSEDTGRIINLSPNIRHWRKKAQHNLKQY